MSSFTSPLIVRIEQGEHRGRGLATVLEPFRYHVGSYPSQDIITVEAGFVTDFTSVPWFARPWIPILGRHAKAAVLHDWLLERTTRPYHEVNAIFKEALEVLEIGALRKFCLYWAVKLLGKRD